MGHAKLTDQDHSAQWPAFLKEAAKAKQDPRVWQSSADPLLVIMGSVSSEAELQRLVSKNVVTQVLDTYDEQFAELQLSLHAHLYRANQTVQRNSIKKALADHYGAKKSWQLGAWVYFPWSCQLVHILDPKNFIKLRTIRNQDLITSEQQQTLYDFSVGCVGMSVGSASALSLVQSGISQKIKIADGAVISGSNLNRILTGVSSVGLEKSLVISRLLYEMNPFIKVIRHGKVTKSNIGDLFDGGWPLQTIIDEIDDLEVKIRLRIAAKKRKIPVLMATELADAVMLDVERFDLEADRPLFHGLVPDIETILDKPEMSHRQWMKYAVKIIGPHNMPLNMQKSLLKIGSSIVTHPQLGSTVMVTGGMTTYAVKQIALSKPLPSGRTSISLDDALVADYRKFSYRRKHRKHTKVIVKAVDSM